jgi:quercetin dioxygenase-like cupin family protein
MTDKPELPQVIELAEGIKIVDDVTAQKGVETLEGSFGPLFQGAACQTWWIEVPPGMYMHEHAHDTESIIFTINNKWVLCSGGNRHVMKAGSVFWFGPGIATGWENPFDKPARVIVFKGQRYLPPAEQLDYLYHTLKPKLEAEYKAGEPMLLKELSEDHPARVFAAAQGWRAE